MNILNKGMLMFGSSFFMFSACFIRAQSDQTRNISYIKSRCALLPEQLQQLRVMTFNIRHGRGLSGRIFGKINLDRIAEEINKGDADVVALQEVDRYLARSGREDQAAKLADMLGMHSTYGASLRFGRRQYGNAILSRYPIVHHHVHLIHSLMEQRSLLSATIQIGDRRLTMFNTHLGLLQKERRLQVRMIAKLLRETEGPVVLTGDFNMESDNPLFKKLPSSFKKMLLRDKGATFYRGGEIDHIYTNIEAGQETAWIQLTQASDHYPVVAELSWK